MKLFTYKNSGIFSGLLCIISILLFECRKNEDLTINQPYQPVYVSGGVFGNVINEQGNPESNVKVSNGNMIAYTDDNGVFILSNQVLNQDGAQIKFEKDGFFIVYKTIIPIKNKMVSVQLQLIRRLVIKSIDAVTGDVIVANGNAQIAIPAQSITDAAGKIYSGQVKIFEYWMNPILSSTHLSMPGNLTGRDKDGNEVTLQTFGMMNIELEDPAGNPLNIAMSKQAELKFPIPDLLGVQAKSSIPLWYYDVVKNAWIQEGIAIKEGNFFVGHVSRISNWSCNYSFSSVNLKGHVLDASRSAIGNCNLEILDDARGQKIYGTTSADGYFNFKLAASSSYTVSIGENQCTNPSTLKFLTAQTDYNLGDIVTNLKSTRLHGAILDCTNKPISESYLQLWMESKDNSLFFVTDEHGLFDVNALICQNVDWNYKAIDYWKRKQSSIVSISKLIQTDLNIATIKTCNVQGDYITIYINGSPKEYLLIQTPPTGNIKFDIEGRSDSTLFRLQIKLSSIDIDNMIQPRYFSYINNNYDFRCTSDCMINVTLYQFGPIGTQVKGSLNGTLINGITSLQSTIQGDFTVIRKY